MTKGSAFEKLPDNQDGTYSDTKLEDNHEAACQAVMDAGQSTGHADTELELVQELLSDIAELKARIEAAKGLRTYTLKELNGVKMTGDELFVFADNIDKALEGE